jgi:hypothetical protein
MSLSSKEERDWQAYFAWLDEQPQTGGGGLYVRGPGGEMRVARRPTLAEYRSQHAAEAKPPIHRFPRLEARQRRLRMLEAEMRLTELECLAVMEDQ